MATDESEQQERPRPSLEPPRLRRRRTAARPTSGAPGGAPSDSPSDAPGGLPGAVSAESPTQAVAAAPPQGPHEGPHEDFEPAAARRPRVRRPPGGHAAATITGLVVALVLIAATLGSQRLCDGAGGCGTGPALLLLAVVVGLAALTGAVLLGRLGVRSGGTVSVLAVALVAVLATLFLLDSLDESWAVLTVAALTVLAFVLARWLTARYIDPVG